MNNLNIITSYDDFEKRSIILENVDTEEYIESIDQSIIEKLIDLAGSEEDVEAAAKEAFEELEKSFERNEVEFDGSNSAENLAISALVVKLVEQGKIGPDEADDFIENIM
jgi:hypothetical protein